MRMGLEQPESLQGMFHSRCGPNGPNILYVLELKIIFHVGVMCLFY